MFRKSASTRVEWTGPVSEEEAAALTSYQSSFVLLTNKPPVQYSSFFTRSAITERYSFASTSTNLSQHNVFDKTISLLVLSRLRFRFLFLRANVFAGGSARVGENEVYFMLAAWSSF